MRSSSSRALVAVVALSAACSPTSESVDRAGIVVQATAQSVPAAAVVPAAVSTDNAPPGQPAPPRVSIAWTPGTVINQPAPVPLPAPALHRPPVVPALPRLPLPTSHVNPMRPPPGLEMEGCGQVWNGSAWAPIACVAPKLGSNRTAEVVVAYNKMLPPIEQLPAIVDHRADGTEGPVRQQHGPECTAFSFTSALDHAYARWTGAPGAFSVMQVWARYYRFEELGAAVANVGDVISNEAEWPYDATVANGWRVCDPKEPGVVCGQPVDEARLRAVDAKGVAVITKIELVAANQLGVLREKLAAGDDAVVSIRVPAFKPTGVPGSRYVPGVPPDDLGKKPRKGRHSILVSGYAVTPNGTFYLVHNSMGTQWGDDGYAWLHEESLRAFFGDQFAVIPHLEPIALAKLREEAQGGLSRACDGDQVPDSITGMCAGRCPDGSPRHNNVCPRPGECPRGQVNLTGDCLLAGPTGSGSDPTSGVSWACGPGGCSYSMPKGVLNCVERACAVSCPAPDFRLATTPRGFVCVD